MRLPPLLLFLPAGMSVLLLNSCDGGFGAEIHKRRRPFTAAEEAAKRPTSTARSAATPRGGKHVTPPTQDAEAPEQGEAVALGPPISVVPQDDGAAQVEGSLDGGPSEPALTDSQGGTVQEVRSGSRGRGGRRSGGSHASAVITVLDPGSASGETPGRITGTVFFAGEPPLRRVLDKIAQTQGCAAHTETPLSEEVVVHGDRFQNVFVYLRSIPPGVSVPPPPKAPLVIDQRGCMYVPHVIGIQAGRPLQAANADQVTHNVHSSGVRYPGSNLSIQAGSAPLALPVPTREEIPIQFACDIHPWMSAKVCVVEHPWFAVTGSDGTFVIEDVPPGTYRIESWQETYGKGKLGGEVTVGAGGLVQVEITYKP